MQDAGGEFSSDSFHAPHFGQVELRPLFFGRFAERGFAFAKLSVGLEATGGWRHPDFAGR